MDIACKGDNMGEDNFIVKLNEFKTHNCPYRGCLSNHKGHCNSINVNKQIKEGEIISDFQCPSIEVMDDVCEFCGELLVGEHICKNGCLDGVSE